jgi:hypothetical protein
MPQILSIPSSRIFNMSMARCREHPPQNDRAAAPYTACALPVGYPQTAAICGRGDCRNAALLWLTDAEQETHATGNRIFCLETKSIKVCVQTDLHKPAEPQPKRAEKILQQSPLPR